MTTAIATAPPAGPSVRSACLQYLPNRHTDAKRRAVWGEVAEIDGQLYARAAQGAETYYARVPADARLDRHPNDVIATLDAEGRRLEEPDDDGGKGWNLLGDGVVVDHEKDIRRRLDARSERFHELDPQTATDKEVARFVDQYPTVSAMLGLSAAAQLFTLFTPGRTLYPNPRPQESWFVHINWREFLERHLLGDYGVHGRFSDRPLDESERFILGLLPTARQNDSAILSGSGLVLSKYPIDVEAAPRHGWRADGWKNEHFVEVATVPGRTTILDVVTEIKPPA